MTLEWTAPRTYTTGETITGAIANVHWRDNLTYLAGLASLTAVDFPATCDPRYAVTAAAFAVANHCHYNRIYHAGAVASIRLYVNVSSGNISVAVYDQTGSGVSAAPSTRQQTSGAVACPAAGSADVALGASVTVGHATHWFALSCDNITAKFYHAGTILASWTNGVNAAQATAHPAPATATPATLASFLCALIGV